MSDYTIAEEPLDPKVVGQLLPRQDENLGPESGAPMEFVSGGRLRFEVLKAQILDMERNLFTMKRQLETLRMPMHGRIVIPAPNPYRCNTCGNEGCLHLEMHFCLERTVIRNQTTMNGCLAWLPPVVP
jgi:hypothetical protein